ncbi:MAG: hypothetical protein ACQCN6_01405 [Candidatus Bathyarchaeia archaeon]
MRQLRRRPTHLTKLTRSPTTPTQLLPATTNPLPTATSTARHEPAFSVSSSAPVDGADNSNWR